MYTGAYILVILVAGMNVAHATGDSATSVFQPPENSDISQIKGTSTPWVKEEFKQTIEDFAKNTSEELQSLDLVKKIYNVEVESNDTRSIFFNQVNKLLSDIGHPAPAALANIVSKAGSLFEPLSMEIFFKAVNVMTAEFFLARGLPVDRSLSQAYASAVQSALVSTGTDKAEAILQGCLNAYGAFAEQKGFNDPLEVVDEQFELFASELIVLHDM